MKAFIGNVLAAIMIVAGCQRIDLPCVQQIQDNEISLISSSKKVSPDMGKVDNADLPYKYNRSIVYGFSKNK